MNEVYEPEEGASQAELDCAWARMWSAERESSLEWHGDPSLRSLVD